MSDSAPVIRLRDYQPTPYAIDRVDLDVRLNPQMTRVVSRLHLNRRDGIPAGMPLVLDGDGLALQSLHIDGVPVSETAYTVTPDRLELAAPPVEPFVLEITTLTDPSANTQLMGLYRSNGTYCTQCEAEGFRRITYFLDRPDVLARYTTRIEADRGEAPVLLSNGNCIESGAIADTGRHYAVWQDPFPKPSYLFALVAGDLACVSDTFTTMSGRVVDLRIYVEHGKEARCAYAMDSLKRAMAWDEKTYGREYDLDIFMIVAVSDFNMGAMENKGLNIFNDKFVLADADTATDQDYARIEAIIAHEYFHNWTGNRITCRDWFQLCLKEGLTVFRDQEFSSDERSRAVKRVTDARLLKAHQFPEDAGPLAHPVRPDNYKEINNFYTATVYEKGAELVRMLTAILGEDGFRKGLDHYFDRHDGDAATVEDFLTCFSDATGADLDHFMAWYRQAGTPSLVANGAYDAAAKTYTLAFEQSTAPTPGQDRKEPLHIPARFGLLDHNGQAIAYDSVTGAEVEGDVIHIRDRRHAVTFTGVASRPVPSLLRGYSAPVALTTNLTDADQMLLLRADPDPFNRWQAAQVLATGALKKAVAAIRQGSTPSFEPSLVRALGSCASDETLDPAFRALLLQMPTETDIAREIGADIDPDAIYGARQGLLEAIATANRDAFAELYDRSGGEGAYSPDAASAGRRDLRNTLLALRMHDGSGETAAIAQFDTAGNMTDRMAALAALVMAGSAEAPTRLEAFHDRHADDPLVVDKWLTVQAMAPGTQTLKRVRALLDHPSFSMANPNRLRALVGAFIMGNPTGFNSADGAGYDFAADMILKIDPDIAQVAARLANAFRSWRMLEPGRRQMAQAALQRIAAAERLSRDTRDIVERCLDR